MEHVSTSTLIIILILLVIISAYFSASETGMMTINRYRLRHQAKQGNRAARRVERLLEKPERLLSLIEVTDVRAEVAEILGRTPAHREVFRA